MQSSQFWDLMSVEQKERRLHDLSDYRTHQEKLVEPMPWIGMYISVVSLFCTLAMSVDLLNGIRYRRFWLPCKVFSLNARSLSLLAVIMKLAMDFSNAKLGISDSLASVTSLVFTSTAMGNFMTSVGSMDDSGIISSLSALCVLVVTVALFTFLRTNEVDKIYVDGYEIWSEQVVVAVFLLLLLIPFCSLGVVVDTFKKDINTKFCEMHEEIKNDRLENKRFNLVELENVLRKYWVMAETGSMQFVIARSAICVIPNLVCLLMALICAEAFYRMSLLRGTIHDSHSNYKWSIIYVTYAQVIGIAIGIISPLSRLYIAAKMIRRPLRDELQMESYWTKRLVRWRNKKMGDWGVSRIPSLMHSRKWKAAVYVSQRTVLYICIMLQTLTVLASKFVLILSVHCIVKLVTYPFSPSSDGRDSQSTTGTEDSSSDHVLKLEGELELPEDVVANICKGFDIRIKRSSGIMYKRRRIAYLLKMSTNFNGVRDFDSNKVQSIHSYQEPPNCWSLPLATLACIVQAVPHARTLPSPVLGLRYAMHLVKLVDKMLDTNPELSIISEVAYIVWDDLELHQQWQDKAIVEVSCKSNTGNCTYKGTLRNFYKLAKKIVVSKGSLADSSAENSPKWPHKFIAANSMYRICGTLRSSEDQTDEQMFKRLSTMIADILVACLTNLPRAIIMQCDSDIIAKKESSVRHAAGLIYEVTEIVEWINREWPDQMGPKEAGCIDSWRAILKLDDENPATSVSATDNISVPRSSNGHVSIGIEI